MSFSEAEKKFTSTGDKLWRHPEQMNAYRSGSGKTVVTTHISPEGACNLKCTYCSVTYRKVSNRIDFDRIKEYVKLLLVRGLKAAILTGGGEPTIYPNFNELVIWLKDQGLKVALITNATQTHRVDKEIWKLFSWVRFSINLFDDWEKKIKLPTSHFNDETVIGSSFVFTQKHQNPEQIDVDLLKRVAVVARNSRAQYVRLLPNCLLPQTSLTESHKVLDAILEKVNDDIFFHQNKNHEAPKCNTCHQSYFRPYLSEVPFRGTKVPGSVYPCDSVVLNNEVAQFVDKYQLCKLDEIGDYLDGKIKQTFDPRKDCTGCVFTRTVNMLDRWKNDGEGAFKQERLTHEEFV